MISTLNLLSCSTYQGKDGEKPRADRSARPPLGSSFEASGGVASKEPGRPSCAPHLLASDAGNGAGLVFFLFDLLHLDGDDVAARPLIERKERLAALLADTRSPLQYSDHQVGQGPAFFDRARAMKLEGIVSKRVAAAYAPGNRELWLKVKCLHREEFVVVGWTNRARPRQNRAMAAPAR